MALALGLLAGCAAGAGRHPPTAAAAAPAPSPSRLDQFASARAAEIALARKAAHDIETATSALTPALQVRMRGVKTVTQHVVDGQSHATRDVEVLDSLVTDVPLALRGTPEHDAVMQPVKALATSLAGSRGSAAIDRAFATADARNDRIVAEQATVKTSAGQDITVRRLVDPEQLRGFERVTVRGSPVPGLP